MVLPKNCLDTVGEQPPPAGVTGADRMAASEATVATARPATAPIRRPLELIFPLNTGRMEIPFVGFPRLAQTAPGALLTLTWVKRQCFGAVLLIFSDYVTR